jgi:hypothetical protein
MAQDYEARVIRAYSLPVTAFDHLKGYQRLYQHQADPTAETHTVTNSEALTRILADHYKLGMVASRQHLDVQALCNGLANGTLVVQKSSPGAELN